MKPNNYTREGLRIVVVGLRFGESFVPIYRDHPDVAEVAVCDLDADLVARVADEHGISRRYTDLDAVLADDSVDAVHLVTNLPFHADQTVASLRAGKHTACAIPAAVTVEDLWRVVEAEDESGKNYMMMETAVYNRQFFIARRMMDNDEFGPVTYARGTHFQDMSGWPEYWRGFPPMHNMTHAISPILALLGTHATTVRALGGGLLPADEHGKYGNPFPATTAQFELAGTSAVADVTRSLFQTARSYTESFSVYGARSSFEWAQLESEDPIVFTMGEEIEGHRERPVTAKRIVPAYDEAELLPQPIRHYAHRGHGGAEVYLVHEFISSIVEGRPSAIDSRTAAAWTAAGIVAHDSALAGGEVLSIPNFSDLAPLGRSHETAVTAQQ